MALNVAQHPQGPDPPGEEEYYRKPWKYIGYKGYSDFIASDKNSLIFRRFGSLNVRVLLLLQDQICQLETRLEQLDAQHSKKSAEDIHNGSFRLEDVPERTELLLEIHVKLKEYNDLLIQHTTLRSHPKVPQFDIDSLKNWLYNAQKAINPTEVSYLDQQHDLLSVIPAAATSPLRRLLAKSSKFNFMKIWRKKAPPHAESFCVYPETVHYSSDARMERFVTLSIMILGTAMLIVPLWVLAITPGTMERLGIISGFVLFFIVLVAGMTVARPFETLAAAAAYSAVLVVFLQTNNEDAGRAA